MFSKPLRLILSVALLLLGGSAFAPSASSADGLPLPVDQSPAGVTSPDGEQRYLTAQTRAGTTVISQHVESGALGKATQLRGRYTVPAVAYDGTSDGLSNDERRLVLINPRRSFPRANTTFAILDARRLRLEQIVRLRGDFSYDALSPDGRWLYLINYLSRRDPTKYRVRVYDLEAGRLLPKPIVDPRESPDEMNGYAITRATSSDGRWAYTLYRGKEHPFIHALDTEGRRALCIDLHDIGRNMVHQSTLELAPQGTELTVVGRSGPQAIVDTETFEVSAPPEPRARPRPKAAAPVGDDGSPRWTVIGAAGLLGAGLAGLFLARRRGRSRETIVSRSSRPGGAAPPALTGAPGASPDGRRRPGHPRSDEPAAAAAPSPRRRSDS